MFLAFRLFIDTTASYNISSVKNGSLSLYPQLKALDQSDFSVQFRPETACEPPT